MFTAVLMELVEISQKHCPGWSLMRRIKAKSVNLGKYLGWMWSKLFHISWTRQNTSVPGAVQKIRRDDFQGSILLLKPHWEITHNTQTNVLSQLKNSSLYILLNRLSLSTRWFIKVAAASPPQRVHVTTEISWMQTPWCSVSPLLISLTLFTEN